MTVSERLIIRD